jgi:MraZ protein
MALFLSTYTNKIDKKGRVSVPSQFRSELTDQQFQGVVLFRSNAHNCLEGFPWSYMQEIGKRLDNFDLFSSEQDDLATAVFGNAVQLPFDGDGRIILPADLIGFGGFDEKVSFVGMGTKFQLWCPQHFEERQKIARQAIQKQGLTIPKQAGDES